MIWGWIIKERHTILSKRYFIKLVKRYYFTKFFSLFSPFDKHFPCFPSSFVYARVQPKILSLFAMYLFPTLQVTVFSFFHEKFPKWNAHLSDFILYISCISHLALVQVIVYFYLYFKNKTHEDSKDVYNFTYSQYLE